MNPFPLLLRAYGATAEEVLALVRHRIATGPFAPAKSGESGDREIVVAVEVEAITVWESPGYLTPPPSVLGVLFDERLPAVRVEETQFNVGAERPKFESPLFEARLALDATKQRAIFDRFALGIADRVRRAFPFTRRDGKATLRCIDAKVHWPEDESDDGCRLELALELQVECQHKPRLARGRIPLGVFGVLAGDGSFGSMWKHKRFAADDYDSEFANMMRMRLRCAFGQVESMPIEELRRVPVKALFELF